MTTNADIDKALKRLASTLQSQDPIDAAADTLRIATRVKRYGEAFHKDALANVTQIIGDEKINAVKDLARNNKFKTEKTFSGAHMTVLVSCNAPASRSDITQFTNELIKAGVKKDIIDKCLAASVKQSAPATTISAVET